MMFSMRVTLKSVDTIIAHMLHFCQHLNDVPKRPTEREYWGDSTGSRLVIPTDTLTILGKGK
jgi:hypothetical protein